MSCWVVPTVAAEWWGISLDQVMSRVHSGSVESKTEHGWLWVDIAPPGQPIQPPLRRVRRRPPPTFTAIAALTGAEVEALAIGPIDRAATAADPSVVAAPTTPSPSVAELPLPASGDAASPDAAPSARNEPEELGPPDLDAEPDNGVPLGWRKARQRVGRSRRRPPSRV